MKKFILTTAILFSLLFLGSVIYSCIWFSWIYPKSYEANLKLADDASLPATKAEYLKAYLEDVKAITGKPRYIFMKPDLELSKQISILEGLIVRFEDIAKIAPSEMAYQQGMEQLSGQEIDNQLIRVSDIFLNAKSRENVMLFWFVLWGWLFYIMIGGILWVVFCVVFVD